MSKVPVELNNKTILVTGPLHQGNSPSLASPGYTVRVPSASSTHGHVPQVPLSTTSAAWAEGVDAASPITAMNKTAASASRMPTKIATKV